MTGPVSPIRCPVCGSAHATCSGSGPVLASIVDIPQRVRGKTMPENKAPELKDYEVLLNGTPTTVQLTEEDYKKQGWATPPTGGPAVRERRRANLTSSAAKAKPLAAPNKGK